MNVPGITDEHVISHYSPKFSPRAQQSTTPHFVSNSFRRHHALNHRPPLPPSSCPDGLRTAARCPGPRRPPCCCTSRGIAAKLRCLRPMPCGRPTAGSTLHDILCCHTASASSPRCHRARVGPPAPTPPWSRAPGHHHRPPGYHRRPPGLCPKLTVAEGFFSSLI
jgi:hypothetical protein